MINLQTRSTFHTSSWLGELPSDWRFSKFKRHAWFKTGTTPPTDNQANYSEQGFPWLRPEDIIEGRVFAKASKFLSEEGLRYVSVSRGMATVICGIGTIGKIALVKNRFSSNQQLISIDSTFDNYFCYYLCLSARSEFESLSTGNVVRILNTERLGNLEVPVPPLGEQRQIAAYLNRETAKIDKLIAKQQKLIKLLQEKRQAVISQAVTKGLDPNVRMKDSGVEWLGEIPESWQIFSLKKIARLNDGNHGEEYPTKEDFVEANQGVPFIRPGNISNFQVLSEGMVYISEEKNRTMRKGGLRTGDILFTNRGEIGKIALIDEEYDGANLNSQVAYLRISDRKVNHIFLLFSLSSTWIKSQVLSKLGGSVLTQFPLKDLGNLLLPLPSIDEQEKIVTELKSTISKIEKLNTSAQDSIHLMKERRQALITAAVTGKIDVRGLVTDDEVAALDQEPDVTAFSDEEITDLENESADDELTA